MLLASVCLLSLLRDHDTGNAHTGQGSGQRPGSYAIVASGGVVHGALVGILGGVAVVVTGRLLGIIGLLVVVGLLIGVLIGPSAQR